VVDIDTVRSWQGRAMVDRDGDKVGTIESIYIDDQTGEPEWALVNTGLFGTKSTFVPLAQANPAGDDVQVPYEKQLIKDARGIDPDGHLSEAEEQQLWRHYGLDYGAGYTGQQAGYETAGRAVAGTDAGGYDREATDRDDAMTRSEEELRVGTQARERGRVRLRKYVTTDEQQVTVPVRREEVRLEHEPPTDANVDAEPSGAKATDSGHEVVLHEE
jgi:sporulation protein YlmC with PRC-barrel domain